MKKLLPVAVLVMLLSGGEGAMAQVVTRTGGVGLRGSSWGLPGRQPRLVWEDTDQHRLLDSDGLGLWLSFFSRAADHLLLVMDLGAVVRTVEEVEGVDGRDTYVDAVVPVLAGLRLHPTVSRSRETFLPYVSAGLGPYWAGDIRSTEVGDVTEVTSDFDLLLGGYLGGGLDLMFTDWMGLNLDFKRHFVHRRGLKDCNGWELGAGMQFLWGRARR